VEVAVEDKDAKDKKLDLTINMAKIEEPEIVGDPSEVMSAHPSTRPRTHTISGIFKRRTSVETDSTVASPTAAKDNNTPRSLRFTFNSNTTSSKPPDEFLQDVIDICNSKGITYRVQTRYLLECTFGQTQSSKNQVKFEVEVCKLPRLNNLHGLRFKRLAGSVTDYKAVCEILLSLGSEK
jgi:MAP/microtubule affinity-regulating kinase